MATAQSIYTRYLKLRYQGMK